MMENNMLLDWNYVKKNVRAGLRPHLEENAVTMKFQDLDIFFYIPCYIGLAHVNSEMFAMYGVSLDELFDIAMENTMADIAIKDMRQVIIELSGGDPDDFDMLPGYPQQLVITSTDKYYGAVGMISGKIMEKACRKLNTDKVYILPSSVHEVIVVSAENIDVADLENMVRDINASIVDDRDRLSNYVYMYSNGEWK